MIAAFSSAFGSIFSCQSTDMYEARTSTIGLPVGRTSTWTGAPFLSFSPQFRLTRCNSAPAEAANSCSGVASVRGAGRALRPSEPIRFPAGRR